MSLNRNMRQSGQFRQESYVAVKRIDFELLQ